MPRVATLDLRLSAEARAQALSLLSGGDADESTLCLLKGSYGRDSEEHWHFGVYGPDNIDVISQELEGLERPLLYDIGGLTVAIPQFHLLSELSGKTLALRSGRVVVLES